MKKSIFTVYYVFSMLVAVPAFAQIGIGTANPAPSAALEVSSTGNNKGILVPRISAAQKNAIASPAEGLLIYQTTAPVGFYYYTGTAWKLMANTTDITAGSLTGIIPIANGGTNSTAVATAGGIDMEQVQHMPILGQAPLGKY